MTPILEVHNLSKKFKIARTHEPYITFRDAIVDVFKFKERKREFWALRNVNFDICQGESIGIVGRNGSGKSTLLKIFSRITPPTQGNVVIRGKVASLLEVGTGFHPELTGRENVYLNGAIIGMKRAEVKSKFNDIVDFSQVGDFLDVPLKRYSSGMQLRLAFSVASFLDSDILIIDEVLAVGDDEFQKKCVDRVEKVRKEGRTIILVSHNVQTVQEICEKAILLEKGELKMHASVHEVVKAYTSEGD